MLLFYYVCNSLESTYFYHPYPTSHKIFIKKSVSIKLIFSTPPIVNLLKTTFIHLIQPILEPNI